MQTIHIRSEVGFTRAVLRGALGAFAAVGFLSCAQAAQVVVYQEGFETDGEGVRYVTQGRGKLDPQPPPAGFAGPSFWELNYNVSFVGVRAVAPAKRAAMVWQHTLTAAAVTENALKLVDATAAWLASGRTSKKVLFSPPRAGTGDDLIIARLVAAGFTVVDDDTSAPPPDPATIAFAIHSSSGVPDPTRFTTYQAPLLSYNAGNHDDELISSIGATVTTDLGPVTVSAPGHPIAVSAGLSGSFPILVTAQSVDTVGANVPAGSTTVATYDLASPRLALTLADADEMISGSLTSVQVAGAIPAADLVAGEPGWWDASLVGLDGYPVPGNPDNTATYGVRGTGRLVVAEAGTYGFAFGVDDAARLRIDLNRNGLDAGDTVLNEEDGSGFRVLGQKVTFPEAGTYDFEWVTLCTGANYGVEVSVALEAEAPIENWDPFVWELLSKTASGPVHLEDDIAVTSYVPTGLLIEKRPYLVVVEGGAALLGGPLTGYEGNGFWAGADLNEPSYEPNYSTDASPRSLTLSPVDVRGLENVQLVVAVAGSDVDFEDPDFFRISADPDGAGPAPSAPLAEFRQFAAGTPNRGALGDIYDGQATILRSRFKDVTYNIPAAATDLVIRFEAHSTFFNEVVGFDNIRILAKGPDLPVISVRRDGVNVVVEYTGVLQSAETVGGPYTDVNGAVSPLVLTPGSRGAHGFYRARNP